MRFFSLSHRHSIELKLWKFPDVFFCSHSKSNKVKYSIQYFFFLNSINKMDYYLEAKGFASGSSVTFESPHYRFFAWGIKNWQLSKVKKKKQNKTKRQKSVFKMLFQIKICVNRTPFHGHRYTPKSRSTKTDSLVKSIESDKA